jgi:hypothetical protein
MPFQLTWLSTVLKDVGLKVAEVPGWMNRGHGDVHAIKGVMCHHTAGPKAGNMPSLNTVVKGTSKISGPLAQLGLGRDGTFYIVAAGLCFHAGKGNWRGLTDGNGSFIGIEAENSGTVADLPWPDVQMDAYRRGVAAILTHIGQDESMCCGHKEYRLPIGFKTDPLFDMDDFRNDVATIMNGTAPIPKLIPKHDNKGRPTLRRGAMGDRVREAQAKLGFSGADIDGNFGPLTESAVRRFQRDHGLVPDGIIGPKTWAELDG